MTSWVENEMKASQMPDKRLEKRLSAILGSLSENPEESIPSACQGWTETQAAYRFLDNSNVGLGEILSGHKAATLERNPAAADGIAGTRHGPRTKSSAIRVRLN